MNMKFPPILDIELEDYNNSLENSVFQTLIKCKNSNIKSLKIWFENIKKLDYASTFCKYLNKTNIQFLSLLNLVQLGGGFVSDEFCEFLRNSIFLKGLKLSCLLKSSFFSGLILKSLSVNKSIKILYLSYLNLSHYYSHLVDLLKTNQVITVLILRKCEIKINVCLLHALFKSKSLLYLDISENRIIDKYAQKITELKLLGINVDHTGINQSSEKIIYQKIPKINFPIYLHKYEKFLMEIKENKH